MRKIVGAGVVIGMLMVGYGLYSNGDSGPGSDGRLTGESNQLTLDTFAPTPTPPAEDLSDDDEEESELQGIVSTNGDRCYVGQSETTTALSDRTIIVDPGHGGEDLGTVNTTFGLNESDLVLSIGHLLRDRLVASGAEVCMTRTSDVYLSLEERADFANDNGGDAFVSLHLNSLPDPAENYTMAIWGDEAKDRYLAEQMVEVLRFEMATPEFHGGVANPMSPDVYIIEPLDAYMLQASEMPAVFLEATFLSNPWEAQVFLDGIEDGTRWREHQIADAMQTGLMQYFEEFP